MRLFLIGLLAGILVIHFQNCARPLKDSLGSSVALSSGALPLVVQPSVLISPNSSRGPEFQVLQTGEGGKKDVDIGFIPGNDSPVFIAKDYNQKMESLFFIEVDPQKTYCLSGIFLAKNTDPNITSDRFSLGVWAYDSSFQQVKSYLQLTTFVFDSFLRAQLKLSSLDPSVKYVKVVVIAHDKDNTLTGSSPMTLFFKNLFFDEGSCLLGNRGG